MISASLNGTINSIAKGPENSIVGGMEKKRKITCYNLFLNKQSRRDNVRGSYVYNN